MLKALIENQKIRIDAHQWGTGNEILWDESSHDIHIDKETIRNIYGKQVKVRIKIPINSDRPIQIDVVPKGKKNKHLSSAERKVIKEIFDALSNRETRKAFIDDLIKLLGNYSTTLDKIERARSVAKRLAKHFSLPTETKREIVEEIKQKVTSYQAIFQAENNYYFILLSNRSISIGELPPIYLPSIIRKRRK